MRYWTAECKFGEKEKFYFYSSCFTVTADNETQAQKLLEPIVAEEWAKICPHPAPALTAILPGRLVADDELAAAIANTRRRA